MSEWRARFAKAVTIIGNLCWKFIRYILYPIVRFLAYYLFIFFSWLGKKLWAWCQNTLFPAVRKTYRRIPRRRLISISLIAALLLGLAASWLTFGTAPSSRSAINPVRSSAESKAMEKMADQLINGEWDNQKQAAEDALSKAGITLAEQGSMPKEGSLFAIAPELTLLAYDAGKKPNGGHLTLNELALMLRDLGFPFKEGEDPAVLLQSGIRKWVSAASENPDQVGAAAPLFLQAMAGKQLPSIDLTAADWDPSEYRLTYLELQVFIGAFFQTDQEERQTAGFFDWFFGKTAYAAESGCSTAKEWLNRWGQENNHADTAKFGNELINILVAEVTGIGIDLLGTVVKTVMTSLSALLKLAKLAMLYWSIEVNVASSPGEVHKPNRSEAEKNISFKATAGVNEQKYQEYLNQWNASPLAKEIKECLSLAGLPSPTDTGDIAADVENWDAEWDLIQGGGHVQISERNNNFEVAGQFQMPFTKSGPAKGEAQFVVDVLKERAERHEGEERIVPISARVLVETSAPPLLGTLVNGGKIGKDIVDRDAAGKALLGILSIPDTLLDIIAGWFQEMVEPEAYGYAQVTYHDPGTSDYTYEGWARAVQVVDTNTEKPFNDGFSKGTSKTSSSVSVNGFWKLYARASTAPSKDSWGIFAIGEISAFARSSYERSGTHMCIGGSVSFFEKGSGAGSDRSSDEESSGSLKRTGSEEEGYTFTFNTVRGTGEAIYKMTSTRTVSPSGCEYVLPSSDTDTYNTSSRGDLEAGTFTMQSKERFPEVLQGSGSVKDSQGRVTRWTWNFKRIDPVPGAKSSQPVGG